MKRIPVIWTRCCEAWACCPTLLRLVVLFVIVGAVQDFLLFPVVHSAWNLIGFEGWFMEGE